MGNRTAKRRLPSEEELATLNQLKAELRPPTDEETEALLRRLWRAVIDAPETEFALVSKHWQYAGFQQSDASADVRGGGLLALKSVVRFAETYNQDVLDVLAEQAAMGDDVERAFPWAAVAINASFTVCTHFHVQTGHFTQKKMKAYSLARDEEAFGNTICFFLALLQQLFQEMQAGYMMFGLVMAKARDAFDELLSYGPATPDELMSWSDVTLTRSPALTYALRKAMGPPSSAAAAPDRAAVDDSAIDSELPPMPGAGPRLRGHSSSEMSSSLDLELEMALKRLDEAAARADMDEEWDSAAGAETAAGATVGGASSESSAASSLHMSPRGHRPRNQRLHALAERRAATASLKRKSSMVGRWLILQSSLDQAVEGVREGAIQEVADIAEEGEDGGEGGKQELSDSDVSTDDEDIMGGDDDMAAPQPIYAPEPPLPPLPQDLPTADASTTNTAEFGSKATYPSDDASAGAPGAKSAGDATTSPIAPSSSSGRRVVMRPSRRHRPTTAARSSDDAETRRKINTLRRKSRAIGKYLATQAGDRLAERNKRQAERKNVCAVDFGPAAPVQAVDKKGMEEAEDETGTAQVPSSLGAGGAPVPEEPATPGTVAVHAFLEALTESSTLMEAEETVQQGLRKGGSGVSARGLFRERGVRMSSSLRRQRLLSPRRAGEARMALQLNDEDFVDEDEDAAAEQNSKERADAAGQVNVSVASTRSPRRARELRLRQSAYDAAAVDGDDQEEDAKT